MTIPLIAKRKRSKAADVSRSPLMTTNSSFERESLSFSFSRRRRTVIPRCLLAASCEITVQISPWQSGSYSASLYSRLSRSSLVSASSLSPRIALLSISRCVPCALQQRFSPAVRSQPVGADSRTAVSGCVRSVKFRRRGVQQVCCTLGMESGVSLRANVVARR